jgi:hypothetical protein
MSDERIVSGTARRARMVASSPPERTCATTRSHHWLGLLTCPSARADGEAFCARVHEHTTRGYNREYSLFDEL